MKTYLDCIPCFLAQALRAGRIATDDETVLKELLDEVASMLPGIPAESTPPETGMLIYEAVSEVTGVDDPYAGIKQTNIERALALVPAMKKRVAAAADPLLEAVRVAIAGNVIDFGVKGEVDVEREIAETIDRDFAIFDYDDFRRELAGADEVLYIGDNAGEAVLDRVLIEQLPVPVVFVVRDGPVLNDATREDAERAGIGEVAKIVSSGTLAPGTVMPTTSRAFRERFRRAPLVIAKGQGNYEGLSGERGPIYFRLKAKCPVIADDIGVGTGDIVLLRARGDR